eukprot:1250234-Prorocentrum_lima.AAC.1
MAWLLTSTVSGRLRLVKTIVLRTLMFLPWPRSILLRTVIAAVPDFFVSHAPPMASADDAANG